MKLILNDHVEHLGERGDSVVVKPGYARNYLLPKGLAYLDTPGNRRRFEQEQRTWEEMDLERHSAAEKVAAEIQGTELRFERRAGEKDVLFGSVNVADIARGLAEQGFEIDRRRVMLDHPIKELGSFEVTIQIHRDIPVSIPVHVTRPGDQVVPTREEAPAEEATDSADPGAGFDGSAAAEPEAAPETAEPREPEAAAE
jgi:large subunit ribosomal protein L9